MLSSFAHRATLLSVGLALLLVASNAALAHHPMGDMTPETLWQGLLSGIGHPVIGLDHLTFIIALGLFAAIHAKAGVWLLAGFLPATVAGSLLTVSGMALPGIEPGVALSVIVMGVLLLAGRSARPLTLLLLAATSGLLHGLAYGEAVVGAEPTPIVAYLVGFLIIQAAIALATQYVARSLPALWQAQRRAANSRILGIAVSTTGVAFLLHTLA